MSIEKVNALSNPADMLTKPVTACVIRKFWQILDDSWTCEFEVNLVENDLTNEVDTSTSTAWSFILWLVAATIGMIWLLKTGGELFLRLTRPTIPVRRASPSTAPRQAETRTVACIAMSTRMK